MGNEIVLAFGVWRLEQGLDAGIGTARLCQAITHAIDTNSIYGSSVTRQRHNATVQFEIFSNAAAAGLMAFGGTIACRCDTRACI